MTIDLQRLYLSEREIGAISGLEVQGRWVGGVLVGVYRFSAPPVLSDYLDWLLVQLITAGLVLILVLPIGLALARGEHHPSVLLSSMGTVALVGLVIWSGYRLWKARSLQVFCRLLDEVDRYHAVVTAAATLEHLQSLSSNPVMLASDQGHLLETLQLTRDSLVAGLKTERLLREQVKWRSQVETNLMQLDHNWAILQSIELQMQAEDYTELLQHTLQIGQAVREELVQISTRS